MAFTSKALKFLEALTQRSPQVVFGYDLSSHGFCLLNAAFEQLWQMPRESVMAYPSSLLATIHPEDKPQVLAVYQQLLAGDTIRQLEFRIVMADNQTEKWLCVTPFLLGEEQVLVGYAADITAQKQYNDTLKRHSDKKNSILNILSHDLAAPLSNIQTLAELLEKDLQYTANREVQEIISMIEKSSQQGIRLIQDFVKQEFLESANVTLIKRRVDLVAKIKELMEEYQQTQSMTGKNFHYLTTTDTLFLELDDNKFMQVINNLISNAIKFTPDGGQITVSLEEKEASVLITVADNGIGIPQQYHATLFEKFSPARRTGIKGEPSVGLGMSIIKTIVAWHQGKIWFESQENQGSTFYIEVPKG